MSILQTPQLRFSLDEAADFAAAAAAKLGILREDIASWSFHKRSLDVRHKNPKFQAILTIETSDDAKLTARLKKNGCIDPAPRIDIPTFPKREQKPRIAVIGAGPSGLFTALTLVGAGVSVDIFERGKQVLARARDIAGLMHRADLNPESNICFGEGGAGTYSDGKMMTRTKSKYIPLILQKFVDFGADNKILFEAHPHIGTDKLIPLLKQMRLWLESQGVRYHFNTRVQDIVIKNGICRGIVVDETPLLYDAVFLCIGHSADDMFETLFRRGIVMAPKPLAIGVRVEHPQSLINHIQYGTFADHPLLPPAEYAVRFNDPNLPSAFSFCMCPGGTVVPSQTRDDIRVVNGMSGSFRNGRSANSALVVQVGPEDYQPGPLGGLHWIRSLEKKAAVNCPPAFAPAQSMTDFIAHKTPANAPKTSYSPGTIGTDLHKILPPKVCTSLMAALPAFDRQMHGFVTQEANFIGIESRTSSPVRILRDETFNAVGVSGLYPVGEGAGYAGGITSCALDGIHAAVALMTR